MLQTVLMACRLKHLKALLGHDVPVGQTLTCGLNQLGFLPSPAAANKTASNISIQPTPSTTRGEPQLSSLSTIAPCMAAVC